MTRKPETTSARIATIAARIVGLKLRRPYTITLVDCDDKIHRFRWADIVAVCASALTQVSGREDRETLRKGKLPVGHKLIRRHKPVKRRMNHL
jgi:hypothetical protein